jgi:Tfp pilus assembly protein PilN
MRAVNLIPSDQQRGAGGVAGKSGGGAYFVLGGLALVVAMAALFFSANKSVSDKQAKVASLNAEATAAEAKAGALTSYTKFASIRQKRVDTVKQLAGARFDWAHALREVAANLPRNAWLTSMTASTTPGVTVSGGTTGALRQGLAEPAIVLSGCTTSQAAISGLLTRLRLVNGVDRVSLEDSTKGAAGSGSSAGSDCRGGHAKYPIFNVDVFFKATSGQMATSVTNTDAAGTTTTASQITTASTATPGSTATPATTSTSTPASTTTPGGTN